MSTTKNGNDVEHINKNNEQGSDTGRAKRKNNGDQQNAHKNSEERKKSIMKVVGIEMENVTITTLNNNLYAKDSKDGEEEYW